MGGSGEKTPFTTFSFVCRLDRIDVSLPSHRWTNGWQPLKNIVTNGWPTEKPSKNHWSQWLSRYHSINGNGHLRNHWFVAMIVIVCLFIWLKLISNKPWYLVIWKRWDIFWNCRTFQKNKLIVCISVFDVFIYAQFQFVTIVNHCNALIPKIEEKNIAAHGWSCQEPSPFHRLEKLTIAPV